MTRTYVRGVTVNPRNRSHHRRNGGRPGCAAGFPLHQKNVGRPPAGVLLPLGYGLGGLSLGDHRRCRFRWLRAMVVPCMPGSTDQPCITVDRAGAGGTLTETGVARGCDVHRGTAGNSRGSGATDRECAHSENEPGDRTDVMVLYALASVCGTSVWVATLRLGRSSRRFERNCRQSRPTVLRGCRLR
jgi:hypothetical protein